MNEKEFLKDIGAAKEGPPEGHVDGLFHTLTKARIEELRAAAVAGVNSLFDAVVYDDNGVCITPINIEQKRDFIALAVKGGRQAHVPTKQSFSVSIEKTLDQLAEELAQAKARTER